jgi:hypothetical protein
MLLYIAVGQSTKKEAQYVQYATLDARLASIRFASVNNLTRFGESSFSVRRTNDLMKHDSTRPWLVAPRAVRDERARDDVQLYIRAHPNNNVGHSGISERR